MSKGATCEGRSYTDSGLKFAPSRLRPWLCTRYRRYPYGGSSYGCPGCSDAVKPSRDDTPEVPEDVEKLRQISPADRLALLHAVQRN